jgi:hypothetical protein
MREKCIQIVVRQSKGKYPLRGHSHRWEANIKTDLEGIGWEGVDWIHLAQARDRQKAFVDSNECSGLYKFEFS